MMLLLPPVVVFASKNNCSSNISGYKIVENSVFPFNIGSSKACFFAFYTANPDPFKDIYGDGNIGDTLWYAYYKIGNPAKIYELQKPDDTMWTVVCSLRAVSFRKMYENKRNSITAIGDCTKNVNNYSVPFVFTLHGSNYVLDKRIYSALIGVINLTVGDIQKYIKHPAYQKELQVRHNKNI